MCTVICVLFVVSLLNSIYCSETVPQIDSNCIMSGIETGAAPGPGRRTWVKYSGLVWTVGVPTGRDTDASIEEQAKITFANIDKRLAEAGTSKDKILEATVFLTNLKEDFKGFNEEWAKWLGESGVSRATVGVAELINNDKIEIKITCAS